MNLTSEQISALPSRYVHKKSHLPYDLAKKAINELAPHVTSAGKYRKWIKETKSYYLPIHPERVYPDFDWSDYLDAEVKSFVDLVVERRIRAMTPPRPLWDAIRWAQRYCRQHGITRRVDWEKHYAKADDIPQDIPMKPNEAYKGQGYPGFVAWCGRKAGDIQDAAKRVTPVITLLHPVKEPGNVVQLVSWSDGIGQLKDQWKKQAEYDQIIGCWVLDREKTDMIERILRKHGTDNGGRYTIPNLHQLTWELNDVLDMVLLR